MAALLDIQAAPPRAPHAQLGQRRWGLRRDDMWALMMGLIAFAVVSVRASHDLQSDSYFDLYSGRYVAHHGIPHHEVLTTMAAGRPWLDQQWLAHLVYYLAWCVGGYGLFVVLSAAAIGLAFALHTRTLLRLHVPTQQALIWSLLALIACVTNTIPRAQSFAYPAFVVVLSVVFLDRNSAKWRPRLLFLPVLVAVWANVHGSVLLGAAIVAAYAAYRVAHAVFRRDRRSTAGYAAVAVLTAGALFATPYGWSALHYYQGVLGNSALTGTVMEWKAPSLHDGVSTFYFVTIVAVGITLALVALRRRRLPWLVPSLLTAGLLAMSLRSIRHELWFVLAGTMLAAATKARARKRSSSRLPTAVLAVAAAAGGLSAAVTLMAPLSWYENTGVSQELISSVETALQTHPGASVLADETTATAMLWMWPEMAGHVAFDIRFEQYPVAALNGYMKFLHGAPASTRFADRYQVVLLSRTGRQHAINMLRHDPAWTVVDENATDVLLATKR